MPRSSKIAPIAEEYDENEPDFEGEDSDDWQPEPEEKSKRGAKRKSTSTRTSTSKKSKDDSEEDEDDDEGEDEEEEEFEDGDEDMEDDLDSSKNTSSRKSTSGKKSTTETDARNFPDRQGIFTLYAYKGDLKNGMRANTTICLWRRDGQSLLQKYTREREGKGNAIHFSSTMVYSCWEDRRKDEYLEVRVKCLNNLSKDASRDSKVELLDIDTIEQTCIDEKYLELDLEPYVSYADRKKQEEQANGTQNTTQEEEASEGEE